MKRIVLLMIVTLWLTGCASSGNQMSDSDKDKAYQQYIVTHKLESVRSIKRFKLSGWKELTETHLIITGQFNRDYLISLRNACTGLRYANWIQLYQFDSLMFDSRSDSLSGGPQALPIRCRIDAIYPLTKEQVTQIMNIGQLPTAASNAEQVGK
ncbi:hypothetical protein KDN34_04535 [Shewanella yunxiaonensis]|uniref:Lipoprotein n=1 Tax=Shewanella yunxiaonensis TaxID=2829809 RepID=A0ABX7YWK3_9GAMM|nr:MULTISPECIES: DUF6491 family protein [Shewanella]MDF0532839.1 DUF6491 family protein [Shewanella sp. A32]QUN06721.1 hypothetical protein KDN34_04535 [Shewanella yunxiaonensis]